MFSTALVKIKVVNDNVIEDNIVSLYNILAYLICFDMNSLLAEVKLHNPVEKNDT